MHFLCVVASMARLTYAARSTARPNILIVLGDDTGWGDVSYNTKYFNDPAAGGGTFVPNPPHTPQLDKWATGPGSIVFERFYSGNPVCSPTRAALLSGRTPFRDCIQGANEQQPFPAITPTIAQQVKKVGYRTLFIGKWHLGCLYGECLDWELGSHNTTSVNKWKSANPANLGFDEYHATIAVTPTSTTNCGCNPEWALQDKGCIAGGGKYVNHTIHPTNGSFFDRGMSDVGKGYFYNAVDCQTFWTKAVDAQPYCDDPVKVDRACVTNYTKKIPGDLTAHDVTVFESFLLENVTAPFLAYIALSTNHVPHYALPEWYHAYTDTLGKPAGDYLGSLSQMDDSLGTLRKVLQDNNVEANTLFLFTTDNGPHTLRDTYSLDPDGSARSGGQLAATNGLRQCKASVFEGGIRVPGFISWPNMLGKEHSRTGYVASSLDMMATVNEILGLEYPQEGWTVDSKSLLPLLDGRVSLETAARGKPIGWQYGSQRALTNQTSDGSGDIWKIVASPAIGQCATMLPPYKNQQAGPFLFNLKYDETESDDLCASNPPQCTAMKALLAEYMAGVADSAAHESTCSQP